MSGIIKFLVILFSLFYLIPFLILLLSAGAFFDFLFCFTEMCQTSSKYPFE